jgi:polysaccharide biosynthesis protein PslH
MADALVVCPETPYPTVGGGPLRTACILEYLASRYVLDVITFREPEAVDPRDAFPKGLARSLQVVDLPYHSKTKAARAWRNFERLVRAAPPLVDRFSGFELPILRRYDIAVVEHFWCASYLDQLRSHCQRVVLDLHNVESVLLDRCASTEFGLARIAMRRFSRVCRGSETRLLPKFDTVLVASEADREHVPHAVIFPNAIPLVPKPTASPRHEIVFSGNMAYHPNAAAVRFFSRRVWPILRKRHPELLWRIAGKNADRVRPSGDSRVVATVDFTDAVSTLAGARAAVVPLLSGSGTRFKILEAWAAGVPVVSTTIGAEGLDATPGEHYLAADDPVRFADAVTFVLNDFSLADRVRRSGRALYESRYTWPAAWNRLQLAGL